MRDILRRYLSTKNIKYYFYCYRDDIDSDYIFDDDMLYIRGKETFVPGILQKTIKAIEICQKFEFEYLVRSNISTIINFDLLTDYLESNYVEYGGGITTLKWLDFNGGITHNKYKNTRFVAGSFIIMSKDISNLLVNNKNNLDYTIIDDFSISLFLTSKKIDMTDLESYKVDNATYNNKIIIYRNKTKDRYTDISNMKNIISHLINNQNLSLEKLSQKNTFNVKYGASNTYIDVTNIVVTFFFKDNKIIIPFYINFSDYFGDPVPTSFKKLIFTVNEKIISAEECRYRNIEIIIDQN